MLLVRDDSDKAAEAGPVPYGSAERDPVSHGTLQPQVRGALPVMPIPPWSWMHS